MYCEIVFPKDNEKDFLKQAKILGIKAVCFVYQKNNVKKVIDPAIEIFNAKLCKANKGGDFDFFLAKAGDNPRGQIERGQIDLIFGLESLESHEFMHQKNSGLNTIIAKIASKKDVMIGFSFSSVLDTPIPSKLFGRITQNAILAKKYKAKTVFASFAKDPLHMRSPSDLQSIMKLITNDSGIAKKSVSNLYDFLKRN